MGTQYFSISNATLATVLAELVTRKIGPASILAIEHDGSAWVAIYAAQ